MKTVNRVNKDRYYLNIAKAVSERSTCLKRQYGCVIVSNDEIISTGYNGSPRGDINCCDTGKCSRLDKPHNSGDYGECKSVHAEQNAIISASRRDMVGATMYLWGSEVTQPKNTVPQFEQFGPFRATIDKPEPCPICARMIKNAGIAKVVTVSSL